MRLFIMSICIFIALGVLSASAVEESALNLIVNYSFETENAAWNTPGFVRTAAAPVYDSSTAVDGKKSVRFDGEDGKMIFYWQTFARPRQIARYRISGWLKTENLTGWKALITAELALMEEGQVKSIYINAIPSGKTRDGWREFAADVEAPANTVGIRALLHSIKAPGKVGGRVWYDAVQLVEVMKPEEKLNIRKITPMGLSGIFSPNEIPEFEAIVLNHCRDSQKADVSIEIRDFFGKPVAKLTDSLELPACSGIRRKWTVGGNDKKACGFFSILMTIRCGNMKASRTSGFLVLEPAEKRDRFFGFTGYGAPDCYVRAMAVVGAGSAGHPFPMTIEAAPGVYNWKDHDVRIRLLRDLNYRIIGGFNVFGNHQALQPKWLRDRVAQRMSAGKYPYDDEYFKSMSEFIETLAFRYKQEIAEWSIINEIDLARNYNQYEHDHYIRAVREVFRAFKKIDPEKTVSSIGVASPDFSATPPLQNLKYFMKLLHDSVDSIGYDFYISPNTFGPGRKPGTPEDFHFRAKLLETARISKEYGKKQFSIEEAGYSMVQSAEPDSIYAMEQAAAVLRCFIIARSVPELSHWLYFKLMPGSALEDWFLWNHDGAPMPQLAAYATAARRLAFTASPLEFFIHKDIYAYLFERGGVQVLALWTTNPEKVAFSIKLPGNAHKYDIMNRREDITAGETPLMLDPYPVFLELETSRESLLEALRNVSFTLPEVKADFYQADSRTILAVVANQTKSPLQIQGEIDGVQAGGIIASGRTENLRLTIPASLISSEKELKIRTGRHSYSFRKLLEQIPVKPLPGKFSAAPNLNEFAGLTPIVLDSVEHLYPVDAFANRLWTGPLDLSVRIYLAYDENCLYLGVETVDDVKVNERSGSRIWSQDSLQFALNPGGNAVSRDVSGKAGYGESDFEFAVAKTPEGPQLYCYTAPAATGLKNSMLAGWKVIAADGSGGTTVYKVALPWKDLGIILTPGMVFGFNLIALDADVPGENCHYWLGITDGIAGGKKPEVFRKFIITP